MYNRRGFLKNLTAVTASVPFIPNQDLFDFDSKKKLFFDISLAEWSLHKAIFAKKLDNLDFPAKAKNDFGISIVEYVNTCFLSEGKTFKENGKDPNYLKELLKRCNDNGVKNHLIMCDAEGDLGHSDAKLRMQTVENHYKWIEAAKYLGCKTIRVNAAGKGTADEVGKNAADGLAKLSEFAKTMNINVVVENHGGYSSDGAWLAGVMKAVNMSNCGTLPDFGNFCVERKPKGG
ncbi:MAG: TIM barrel protein, partial [Bacteroidota bacterium]